MMVRYVPARRPNGSQTIPTRSIRIEDEAWEAARRRAKHDGMTVSRVVSLLVEGYGRGFIDPPRVKMTYSSPLRKEAE